MSAATDSCAGCEHPLQDVTTNPDGTLTAARSCIIHGQLWQSEPLDSATLNNVTCVWAVVDIAKALALAIDTMDGNASRDHVMLGIELLYGHDAAAEVWRFIQSAEAPAAARILEDLIEAIRPDGQDCAQVRGAAFRELIAIVTARHGDVAAGGLAEFVTAISNGHRATLTLR